MWSGGFSVQAARTALENATDATVQASGDRTTASTEASDKGEIYGEKLSARSQLQSDLTTKANQLTGAKNGMEGAEDGRRQNENTKYEGKVNSDLQYKNGWETVRHSVFAHEVWLRDVVRDFMISGHEAIARNKNTAAECIRVLHAALLLKPFDAINGTRTSAQILFNPGNYLNHREARKDQGVDLWGQAMAALNSAANNAASLAERGLNTYFDKMLNEKKDRYHKAVTDKRDTDMKLARTEQEMETSRNARDSARGNANTALQAYEQAQAEQQRKAHELSAEQQREYDEKNKKA
ncbi:MAG: hypothetical protein WC956_08275 [bacterium]